MKTLKYILSASISLVFLTACNDSFLEKYPETELNEEAFFQTPEDMAIYLNNSYKDLPYGSDDLYSDNIGGYTASHEVYSMLHGTINENTVGGWSKDEDKDWYNLRKANVLLVNAHKVKGEQTDIDHYIGVARFFRANFYFKMLKRYGAAPWYDHPLSTNDPDLYKGMDSRELIADKILEFAAKNIKAIESRTYINKWAAYSLLARFALHEGTFRKYHTELNLTNTANNFLEKAVWATGEIMKAGFEITGKGAEGYRALFTGDLKGNKEIILYADYDRTLGRGSNSPSVVDWMWHLSRSLADSYLKLNGSPATSDPNYATKTYNEMFDDRDPRMAETIMPAGFIKANESLPTVAKLDYGYLPQLKYYPRTAELNSVELACEGLRYDDLMRWKAGKLLEGPAEGVYIPAFGAYDVTGDGENDIAILESPDKTAGLTEDELSKLQKTYYLVDKDGKKGNIYLSEGNKGNIRFTIDQGNPPRFDETKYYYFPIPFSEIQLNPNLEQPSGWR